MLIRTNAGEAIARARARLAVLDRNEAKLAAVLRQQLNALLAVLDSKRYEDFSGLIHHSSAGDGYGTEQGYIPCPDIELEDDYTLGDSVTVGQAARRLLEELTGKYDGGSNDDVDAEVVAMALRRIQRCRAILMAKLPRPRQNRVTKA